MRDQESAALPEPDTCRRYLEKCDPLREETNQEFIAALDLPAGSTGLDLGCGLGTRTGEDPA